MQKLELTFSLRDWKQGSDLLCKLGMTDELELTDCHELEVEFDLVHSLQAELERADVEFEIEFKK
tara:strand:- start:366 stop:560 length:195 start_codon:yes stop_codon:yes gene_type:complete